MRFASALARRRFLPLALLCALSLTVAGCNTAARSLNPAQPGDVTEYAVPTPNAGVSAIVVGPDSNLWFLESQNTGSKIGRITLQGVITEYPMPAGVSFPEDLVVGPDGNLWYVDQANHIGYMTTGGSYSAVFTASNAADITVGSDKNFWVPESNGNRVDVYNTSGLQIQTYATAYSVQQEAIALGSDGNVWIGTVTPRLGRMTTAGLSTSFVLAPPMANGMAGLVNGPDGNIWVCANTDNLIVKVTTSGTVSASFTVPTTGASPWRIVSGPNGDLWFTELQGNKIGRSTTAGNITEFNVPTANSQPNGIVEGPDGNLWFTEKHGNKIAYMIP